MNENQGPIKQVPDYSSNQPKTWQWILIAGIGLLALLGIVTFISGGYFAATTFLEERNSQAKETATAATAVVAAKEQAIRSAAQWSLVLLDAFNNNDNEWVDGDIDDEYAEINVTINGVYRWVAEAKQGFVWWAWPTSDTVSDFYLAVEAHNQSDNRDAQYGLFFHYDENTAAYKYFEIRDSGYFSVWHYSEEGWIELFPSTYSAAIISGEKNGLEVIALDDRYSFLINGQIVAEAAINSLAEGYSGVAIGLSSAGEESTIVFDNFELRAP